MISVCGSNICQVTFVSNYVINLNRKMCIEIHRKSKQIGYHAGLSFKELRAVSSNAGSRISAFSY